MNLIQKKCSVPFTAVEVRQDMEMMRKWGRLWAQRNGTGLVFCFCCHSPYSFTMRKCRPNSL